MGLPAAFYAIAAAALLLASVAVIGWWIAIGRRNAEAALASARAEAERIVQQAHRDSETARKEAAIEAREQAHAIAADTERTARVRQQEILSL